MKRPAINVLGAILLGVLASSCAPIPPATGPVAVTTHAGDTRCPVAQPCPVCPACPPSKPPPSEARYDAVLWEDVPGWRSGSQLASLRTFIAGCVRAQSRRPWLAPCAEARNSGAQSDEEARAFFESRFTAFRVTAPDGSDSGLITGYYEPVLKGSRNPGPGYRFPVYAVPDDLIVVDLAASHPELRNLRLRGRIEGRRLVPYYPRAEIDSATPPVRAKPLAWVADAVDLFFLQVQGSGLVELESGERIRLGYADQNGHPYRSLGRYLIDRGELKAGEASMQSIKAWASAHPEKLQEAMNANPSYVFFRELPAPSAPADGPPGALGVPLTPGYSAAVDPRFIPLGSPFFLVTTHPSSGQPLERLLVAQDTGGAIRGAVRADFFWGTGEEAGAQAGRMQQRGRVWLLWPRGESPPKPQP